MWRDFVSPMPGLRARLAACVPAETFRPRWSASAFYAALWIGWRASQSFRRVRSAAANLMLKRYGEKALEESATRADELVADGDHDGAVTWRRISVAVAELANTSPPGPVH